MKVICGIYWKDVEEFKINRNFFDIMPQTQIFSSKNHFNSFFACNNTLVCCFQPVRIVSTSFPLYFTAHIFPAGIIAHRGMITMICRIRSVPLYYNVLYIQNEGIQWKKCPHLPISQLSHDTEEKCFPPHRFCSDQLTVLCSYML